MKHWYRQQRRAQRRAERAVRSAMDDMQRNMDELDDRVRGAIDDALGHSDEPRSQGRRSGRDRSLHSEFSTNDDSWYRIPEDGMLAGVCAGIAEVYDVTPLMARGLTVTGALFMPNIVIIAYIIMIFSLPTRDKLEEKLRRKEDRLMGAATARRSSKRASRKQRKQAKERNDDFEDELSERDLSDALDRRRAVIRKYKERMSGIDDRLQGLERHVTSKRFELSREIDQL